MDWQEWQDTKKQIYDFIIENRSMYRDDGTDVGLGDIIDFINATVTKTGRKITVDAHGWGGWPMYDYIVDDDWADTGLAEGTVINTYTGTKIYSTVQGAITAADADNDERSIFICPGTYAENVIVPQTVVHALHIFGAGRHRSVILPSSGVALDWAAGNNANYPGVNVHGYHTVSDIGLDASAGTFGLTFTTGSQGERVIWTRVFFGGGTAAIKDQTGVDDHYFHDCDLLGDLDFGTVNVSDFHFHNSRITGNILKTSAVGGLTDFSWAGGFINGYVDMDGTHRVLLNTDWIKTTNTFHVKIRTGGDALEWVIRGRMAALSGASEAKQYIYILDGSTPQVSGIKIDVQCEVPPDTTNGVNFLYSDSTFSTPGEVQSVEAIIECTADVNGKTLVDLANAWPAVKGVFDDSLFILTPQDEKVNISAGTNNKVLSGDASGSAAGTVVTTDEKVKVSANDTTPNFLLAKLAAGTGITLTETNDAGDEDVTITHASIGSGDLHPEYVLESLFDAQSVLAATADNTPAALTLAEQTVVGRLTGGNVAAVSLGIADNNVVQIDQADAADNDYAKFTANGIEGRSYAEVISDLGLTTVATDAIWDAAGDLAVGSGANTAAKLTKGDDGKVLTMVGGAVAWAAATGGGAMATDPLWDAAGDLAVGTGANTGAKLALTVPGAANLMNVLGVVNGETTPVWKVLFNDTHPEPIGVATEGTGVVAARLNHVHSNTVILSWLFSGNCTVKTHEKKFKLPFATDFSDVKLLVLDGNEPTGDELIVDIQFCTDDATWDTTFSTLPEIDIAAQEDDGNHAQAHTAYAANTYFICKCTQIGSTLPGVGLGVDLILTR